jgi:hypothetical protein
MSPDPAPAAVSTAALREEDKKLMQALQAVGERIERLHELPTVEQMALAREVLEFVRRQISPHARAEEYTLYPAADWAAGENSRLTEAMRYEHTIVASRCEALEKAIQQGAAPGKLMHLCYAILGLVAAHFKVTEAVVLPYLDKAFDAPRFEKEVLTPLRVERSAKR